MGVAFRARPAPKLKVPLRRRVSGLLAALVITGCGETEGITRGGSIIGETLTVYSLLPTPDRGAARDVVDGERLALAQARGRAGAFKVNFASLDSTRGETGGELAGAVAGATRQAIVDAQIVAALSDLDDSTARTSVPLFNAAGILHVSPGVTYPGFTTRVEPGEPERWYPAGERTFFSVAPDDASQARALAGSLRGRVLVEQEESPSGHAFGAAMRSALGPGRLVQDARSADCAVYAGSDPGNADGVVESLLRENSRLRVYLPAALSGSKLVERSQVSAISASPAPDPAFNRAFRAAFGRDPRPEALTGHAAMRGVLDAIARAGSRANSRQAVIDAYARTQRPAGNLFLLSRRRGSVRTEPL
ncbi:MAG: hypothetical protein H0V22_07540 [Solirubrobacterales bacterium]|jgi:branched-chain amino acid transport system substrate-binding protein|nr:hypothetical protein [Solirubrobacterales bacterium]